IDRAAAEAEQRVVAARERPELRQEAEVPFADQRGAVAGRAQQRRQGRMLRRQPDVAIAGERLLEPEAQAILGAAGDQREEGWRKDRGIGVTLGLARAELGDAVAVEG